MSLVTIIVKHNSGKENFMLTLPIAVNFPDYVIHYIGDKGSYLSFE